MKYFGLILLCTALGYMGGYYAIKTQFEKRLQHLINERELRHFHNFPYVYLQGVENDEVPPDETQVEQLVKDAYNTYLLNLQTMGDTAELNFVTEHIDPNNIVTLTREFNARVATKKAQLN